jgi:hypothetical protein
MDDVMISNFDLFVAAFKVIPIRIFGILSNMSSLKHYCESQLANVSDFPVF